LGKKGESGDRILYCSICGNEWESRFGKISGWYYEKEKIKIVDETGYEILLSSVEMNKMAGVWMNHKRSIKIKKLPIETPKTIKF